jgi:hypothetical protein
MPNQRSLSRSLAGGEITPELFGRMDLAAFQTGLSTCRNFEILPHGPAQNRPGFEFVRAVKTSAKRTRLIPFSFSTTQTFALEFGDLYIRFHTMGATLLSGAVPYEVVTPYLEADLFDLHYVQSSDVLTIVHTNYAPRELRRLSATNWTLTAISFASVLAAPTGVGAAATTGAGAIAYWYVVTSLASENLEESLISTAVTCNNNLSTSPNANTITWTAVTGASRYNVYKLSNGLWGYIGQASGTSFYDNNILADVSVTPPELTNPFGSSSNYPGAVSYFEQRRVFAGTLNKPQNVWMTRSTTESNLSSSIPVRDDDAVSYRIASREANTIRHLVPLSDLMILTSSAEWRVTSVNSDAVTATSISVKPQTVIGASNVVPVTTGSSLLYAASRGGRVREMVYTQQTNGYGYTNSDVSMLAPHLFDYKSISDMAFARAPYPILWAVSSDGKLLGLTYIPEQKVAGWHRHDTEGSFESVAVITEGSEDSVYVVVKRNINGADVRYVERRHTRLFATLEDAFFVDSGLTYDGSPATVISGLDHLEGETVSILADGAVHPQAVVTSGSITLEQAASVVHVGLPIESDLKTLPILNEQIPGGGQGRVKNVNRIYMRVNRSSGVFAGPDEDSLREHKQRRAEAHGTAPDMIENDEIEIVLDNDWSSSGHVFIRQSNPLPLTVVSYSLEYTVGG